MLYVQPSSNPGKWHTQTPMGLEIKTDHLISDRRPDLIYRNQQKKRTCKIVDFADPANHRIKLKESEKKNKYQDLATELWNMKVTIIPILIGAFRIVTKGTGGRESRRTRGDHQNYYIIENGQNTEKSPGDLRKLAVTQTPVKDNQLTLMGKLKWVNSNNNNNNNTHKLLWDFKIQTNHLISARRPDFIIMIKKENL